MLSNARYTIQIDWCIAMSQMLLLFLFNYFFLSFFWHASHLHHYH